MNHNRAIGLVVIAALVGGLWLQAGPLQPPAGPVAPSMKTLDEISAQIASLQVASGGAPVKRVVRGVIDFPAGEVEKSQTFSPSIDPTKSIVQLSDTCATATPVTTAGWTARSGALIMSLTESQITVRVDASHNSMPGKVGYQIIEYH